MLSNHSWVSFQGFSEAYNDAFSLSDEQGLKQLARHCRCNYLILLEILELTPRIIGEMFYNGELENELRRLGRLDYRFKLDSDREVCMHMIDELRRVNNYGHSTIECVDDCKKRGRVSNN